MKNKTAEKSLRDLSLSIGDFIRYWGFRRIHGAIWSQLYLSEVPLSCTELARRLRFSKALVSPALAELENFKLIQRAEAVDEKTVLYEAVENVDKVIKHVLKTRERPMLAEIERRFQNFDGGGKKGHKSIRIERLGELRKMISAAGLMLEIMLQEDEILELPLHLKT